MPKQEHLSLNITLTTMEEGNHKNV
jgi:hypothetical protein